MKPVAFDYIRPDTVEEATALLAEHGGDAVLMAGGMSLGPMLNMRLVRPSLVIDIGRIDGLDAVTPSGSGFTTGAVVRQSAALGHRALGEAVPLLHLALPWVGHVQTRNRGTLGGSVSHADPSSEIPLTLATVGGTVRLRSRRSQRAVPARDFFLGMLTTARAPEEMVVALDWPGRRPGDCFGFEEIAQRHGDFALAAAACRMRLEAGRIVDISVGLGGVEDRPVVIDPDGAAGEQAGPELFAAIAENIAGKLDPLSDSAASAPHRRALARVLIRRVLEQALAQSEGPAT